MLGAWMTILRRVPGAVFSLASDHTGSRDNLRNRAVTAGIDPAHLLFADRADPAEDMARLALPDLFLDRSPCNAGTLAGEAIRMGLPVVTPGGECFASCMAARLLQAIGASAGIGETVEHDIEIAVACGTGPVLLAGYKALFTEANRTSAIGDIATVTDHYEDSPTQIERALRGQYPLQDNTITGNSPDGVVAESAAA